MAREVVVEILEGRRLFATGVGSLAAPMGTVSGASAKPAPVVGAAAAVATPASVTAAAKARAHRVTVTWGAVSGASAYRIERNDGSGWKTAGQVGVVQTFEDSELVEEKAYRYRVVALSAGGESAPTAEATVTTAAYRLLDGMLFSNMPNPLAPGVERVHIAYGQEFFDYRGDLSKTQTRDIALAARDEGRILVIDI